MLLLSVISQSGCATLISGNFAREYATKHFLETRQAIQSKDYIDAIIRYSSVYEMYPEALQKPHLNRKDKEKIVGAYLFIRSTIEAQLGKNVEDFLMRLGITQEELQKGNAWMPTEADFVRQIANKMEKLETICEIARSKAKNDPKAPAYYVQGASDIKKLEGTLGKDSQIINRTIAALEKVARDEPRAIPDVEKIKRELAPFVNIDKQVAAERAAEHKRKGDEVYEAKVKDIIALGETGGEDAMDSLIKFSKDENPGFRYAAIYGLSGFSELIAEKIIINAINDPEAFVRQTAVSLLADKAKEDQKIADLIIERLHKEQDIDVRIACIESLAGNSHPKVKKLITGFLNHEHPWLRAAAVLSLGQYQDKEITELIAAKLDDKREEVRQAAVLVMADRLKKYPLMFGKVYQKISDPSPTVSFTAVVALSRYVGDYPQLEEPVSRMLKGEDLFLRQEILAGLGQSNSPKAINLIKPYLIDNDLDIKQQALISLGQIDSIEVIPLITPFVNDPLWEVKYVTAIALGMQGKQNLIEPIRALIKDKNPLVRQAAINSFAQIPDAPIIEIAPYLADSIPEVKLAAIRATSIKAGVEPIISNSFLKLAREDFDFTVRAAATIHLDKIKQPEVMNIVENNFHSHNSLLRQSAIQVAGRIDSPKAISMLTSAVADPQPIIRSAALYGLGNKIIGNPQVIEIVKPYINDRSPLARQAAVEVLGRLDDIKIETLIAPRLQDPSAFVRQTTALSLGGKLQTNPGLIKPFVQTLKQDFDPFTKHIVASALQGLPNDLRLMPEQQSIHNALLPGLRIAGWAKEIAPLTANRVEIGYTSILGSPLNHVFVSATYGGTTTTVGFDAVRKGPGLLFNTPGFYRPEFVDRGSRLGLSNISEGPIIYRTISTDPAMAQRAVQIIPKFIGEKEPYSLRTFDCYRGRDKVLNAIGIKSIIPDTPWKLVGQEYKYSRRESASLSDPYFSYSFKMQQKVTFPTLGVRNIETKSWTNYRVHPMPNFNFQQPSLRQPTYYSPPPRINIPRYPTIKQIIIPRFQAPKINYGR